MFITTAQLHSTKPELRFCVGSNPACGVSEICDGEDLWQWSRLEIRLNAFRRSTIPQKQFIIIIIIIIIKLGKIGALWTYFDQNYFIRVAFCQSAERLVIEGIRRCVEVVSTYALVTLCKITFGRNYCLQPSGWFKWADFEANTQKRMLFKRALL